MTIKYFSLLIISGCIALFTSCSGNQEKQAPEANDTISKENAVDPGDPMSNMGIGPIKNLVLGDLDPAMAAEGEKIYKDMCSACHKPDEKFIGPAPKGILDRRSPEWVMNMILNPVEMVQKDPVAKQLLIEYNLAPMADQNLTEDQARKILEYFRTLKN